MSMLGACRKLGSCTLPLYYPKGGHSKNGWSEPHTHKAPVHKCYDVKVVLMEHRAEFVPQTDVTDKPKRSLRHAKI